MGESEVGKGARSVADVFISYHRSDGASALVRRIAGELESRGVTCWYDTKNAAPVDFIERIVTEIERCKVFLFLWDEKANEDSKKRNSYVRSEIQWAYEEKHIPLFPFQVGNFEKTKTLRFYFGHINIPYGGDTPETAQTGELVSAIAEALGKTQPPPPAVTQMLLPNLESKPEPIAPTKIIQSGKCGNNITYTLDKNGVLTISGNGPMWDYKDFDTEFDILFGITAEKICNPTAEEICNPPWTNKWKAIFIIEIQKGVTAIGKGTFRYCDNLTSVSIPDSVVSIRASAFQYCDNLISVTIPDSVIYIGDWAFHGCNKLKSVSVPAKAEIHPVAFPGTTRVIRRKIIDHQ